MMEDLYRLVWLVYFKPISKWSFFKTLFQSETILWNLWTASSVSQLHNSEWKPQRRTQHYIDWIFKSQDKAGRGKWRCWWGYFTSLKDISPVRYAIRWTLLLSLAIWGSSKQCEVPFQRMKNKDEQRRGKKCSWIDAKRKRRLEQECRELLMILNPSGDGKSLWNSNEAILMSCMLIALMQRQRRVLSLIQQEFLDYEVEVRNSALLLKDKIVYALIWWFENTCFSELSQIHSRVSHSGH